MRYRVAAIQMTSHNDVEKNLANAKKLIADAVKQEAKLIVLPENWAMMGDETDKLTLREEFGCGPIQDFLSAQAAKHSIWLVGGTIPIAVPNVQEKVYATCLVFDNHGKVVSRYDKIHLFDVTLNATREQYNESKTTAAGEQVVVVTTPFGKLGLAVCYDLRFPELFRTMHREGVEVIVLPAAFTYTTGAVHWEVLVRARAIENQIYMIAAAQTGMHDNGRKTYGHSMIVDPWGGVKNCLPSDEGVVIAEIDFDFLKQVRGDFPVLLHRRV
ncbi:MAG: carbon-nitrogen hydrolase family protein [Gammaproteobacteria bacterium]